MPVERYFCSQDLQEEMSLEVTDVEFHHLVNVTRNQTGDFVELVNGQGQLAKAKVTKIEKKRATLEVTELYQTPALETPLILVQGIPRLSKLELILEKGTELGMTEIWLFPASRTEKKQFTDKQLERLQKLLISAMKQCGRLFLPELLMMPPLKEWQGFCLPAFFGDTNPSAPLFAEKWKEVSSKNGSIFCIGPEGGLTDTETATLQELGANGVKLNPNILRTETAAIAALSLASHWQSNS